MTGVLRSSKHRPGMKRPRNQPYRVFDYQHVPVSVTCDFAPFGRTCSSLSPSSADLRQSRDKPQSKHKSRRRGTQLRMEELMCIKKELTVIKSQIDELLDSLEQMDPQNQELCGDSVAFSPLHGSVSSADDSSGSSPPSRTDRETQSPQTAVNSDEYRQHVNDYEPDLFYM
ncbi:uncharacterized protein si:dkey-234i14.2 [Pimephales promelas]|uniref:uncharacterized protein si:dkey-234i14.2 n=1 Tax=Pimephales promelas TaxID=90988 RepID=UPI0019558CF5|nr:uncharacterized protein si:dkey-234i14.2 [Pimephales promelas]